MSSTPPTPPSEPSGGPEPAGRAHPKTAPVTVLGECVGDAFTEEAQDLGSGLPTLPLTVLPGGGPANTAVALARLGTPTRFLGRLSTDVFGRLFRGHLTDSGVDLDAAVAATEPSTLAVATLGEDGSAEYSFHAEGTADFQWTAAELAKSASGPMSCLHTGSLALALEPGGRRIEELLAEARAHTTVSIDPNVRPLLVDPAVYRERLARWCALADILRLSDDDLAHLAPGTRPEEAADLFHSAGVPLVVVTLGGDGVLASLDGVRVRVAAPHVEVVDTVGAGDSFMAGMLHALHAAGALGGRLNAVGTEPLGSALEYGVRVSAAVCRVQGANPPWGREVPSRG